LLIERQSEEFFHLFREVQSLQKQKEIKSKHIEENTLWLEEEKIALQKLKSGYSIGTNELELGTVNNEKLTPFLKYYNRFSSREVYHQTQKTAREFKTSYFDTSNPNGV
jgi:hypothetical protein